MINPGGPAEAADVVVWNDAITHKVEFGPSVDSGFPDPNYLDLVLAQLQNLGLDAIGWQKCLTFNSKDHSFVLCHRFITFIVFNKHQHRHFIA